jgi:hypothetical protein
VNSTSWARLLYLNNQQTVNSGCYPKVHHSGRIGFYDKQAFDEDSFKVVVLIQKVLFINVCMYVYVCMLNKVKELK